MGVSCSSDSASKEEPVDLSNHRRIVISGNICAGKFALFNAVRWVYQSEAIKDQNLWIRRRDWGAQRLSRDMGVTLSNQDDWTLKEMYNHDYDILHFTNETLRSLSEVMDAAPDFESMWNTHWNRYTVDPSSFWWYKRLIQERVENFLTFRDPRDMANVELLLRCYPCIRHVEPDTYETVTDQTYVTKVRNLTETLMNYWCRVEYSLDHDFVYRDLQAIIDEYLEPYMRQVVGCSTHGLSHKHRTYEWVYLSRLRLLNERRKWREMVMDTSLLIHVIPLIHSGLENGLNQSDTLSLRKDLDMFEQIVNEVISDDGDGDGLGECRKKCLLVFTKQDILRDLISEGRTAVITQATPKFKGPFYHSDRPTAKYTEEEWLNLCVNRLTQHIISLFMDIDRAQEFVVDCLVINPTDLSDVSNHLLTKHLFELIDGGNPPKFPAPTDTSVPFTFHFEQIVKEDPPKFVLVYENSQ